MRKRRARDHPGRKIVSALVLVLLCMAVVSFIASLGTSISLSPGTGTNTLPDSGIKVPVETPDVPGDSGDGEAPSESGDEEVTTERIPFSWESDL